MHWKQHSINIMTGQDDADAFRPFEVNYRKSKQISCCTAPEKSLYSTGWKNINTNSTLWGNEMAFPKGGVNTSGIRGDFPECRRARETSNIRKWDSAYVTPWSSDRASVFPLFSSPHSPPAWLTNLPHLQILKKIPNFRLGHFHTAFGFTMLGLSPSRAPSTLSQLHSPCQRHRKSGLVTFLDR